MLQSTSFSSKLDNASREDHAGLGNQPFHSKRPPLPQGTQGTLAIRQTISVILRKGRDIPEGEVR